MELKARDRNPERSLAVCQELGAEALGVLLQRDTYFRVAHGRLKLREEDGGAPHLIAYERQDTATQRESSYRLVAIDDADRMRAALAAALGVEAVVSKARRLFIWETVRIHLDQVDGLGRFLELEAVVSADPSGPAEAERRIGSLRRSFGIEDADLIGTSYGEMATTSP